VTERLSTNAVAIIEALAPDGSTVGNIRLRQQLGLDAGPYSAAVVELKALGLVLAGRGRGGSLALSEAGKSLGAQLVGEEPAPTLDEPATLPTSAGPPASSRQATSRRATNKQNGASGGPLGFEDALWKAADKLRGSMDSGEYKHVVLGLVFLKYIDDAFSERRRQLIDDLDDEGITGDQGDELLESRDEYTAEGVFWVPPEARWGYLQASAKQPEIGKLIDNAMDLVELDNPSLRGVLPKNFSRPALDVRRLGELVDLISGIGLGSAEHREKDILGRVYEYFLSRFASAEGKGAGEFYTPRSVVKLLVEMIEPYRGRVYDPCCGSGGMFVQSERFVEAHGGRRNDIAVSARSPTTPLGGSPR
jgi:type I restriction enzyme M protein